MLRRRALTFHTGGWAARRYAAAAAAAAAAPAERAATPTVTTRRVPPGPGAPAPGPFGGSDGGTVAGTVSPAADGDGHDGAGWGAALRAAFEANFAANMENQAQLCVFHRGACAVDLWGHAGDETCNALGYDGDTLQTIFSSGKNLEAIAVMLLADRGQLRYGDRIAQHWPAFGQHGKERITVADLLRHEAGLQFFADPATPDDFSKVRVPGIAEVSDPDKIERLVEGSAAYGHGERMYHASTRGFVVGGLVRQITGKTLGAFVRDEITEPLGAQAFVGATLAEQAKHRYAPMQKCSTRWTLFSELLPSLFGMKSANDETLANFKVIGAALMAKNSPLKGYAKAMPIEWEQNGGDHVATSTPEGRTLEVSSGGVQASARALARIGACLANDGELEGVRLVSTAAVQAAHEAPKRNRDAVWQMDLPFTAGGFADFGSMVEVAGRPTLEAAARQHGFFGWVGKGGSVFLWNREKQISIGYTCTGMANGGSGGPRTDAFFDILKNVPSA